MTDLRQQIVDQLIPVHDGAPSYAMQTPANSSQTPPTGVWLRQHSMKKKLA